MKKTLRKIVRRLGKKGFMTLCFIPFGAWGLYHNGLPGFLASVFGWLIGYLISKRLFKD